MVTYNTYRKPGGNEKGGEEIPRVTCALLVPFVKEKREGGERGV